MKITKLGHCCLVIEVGNVKILTDPGIYSTAQNLLSDIDIVLITHDHPDHFHIDSFKQIQKNNPNANVLVNESVSELLTASAYKHTVINNNQTITIKDISFTGVGTHHAQLHDSIEASKNTGFLINEQLFYPGDAFTDPNKSIDILALPVAGPWMKLAEAIDYAISLKPKVCFPVHDGILKNIGTTNRIPKQVLSEHGIEFITLNEGDSTEM